MTSAPSFQAAIVATTWGIPVGKQTITLVDPSTPLSAMVRAAEFVMLSSRFQVSRVSSPFPRTLRTATRSACSSASAVMR
jgi:hypothetical protein